MILKMTPNMIPNLALRTRTIPERCPSGRSAHARSGLHGRSSDLRCSALDRARGADGRNAHASEEEGTR